MTEPTATSDQAFGKYGLPLKVQFCRRCTMSNQRPASSVEFRNVKGQHKQVLAFDAEGICDACRFAEHKQQIDWQQREQQLRDLCDRFRRGDGRYDVVVPGSGGKDSVMAAHLLKYTYGMTPILVTWPPALYTGIGRRNFERWLDAGFANYTYHQNRRVHRILTQQAFLNLCHPFQPFMLGQKNLAPKMSVLLDIPLVIFGENEAEYGNPISDNEKPTRDPRFYSADARVDELYLGGVSARELMQRYGFNLADLEAYLPVDPNRLAATGTEVHYLGFYKRWHPQETYYFSVENNGFMPNLYRTEGSFSKYSSLDDKIDWLHYYTAHIKFGLGRASYDSAQEIRNGDLTREEGVALVRRYDGEYPRQYLADCLEYMQITKQQFDAVIEEARTPHLWNQHNGSWQLTCPVWEDSAEPVLA